jgi:hypothetical protein
MAAEKTYFRQIPNFEYVSRSEEDGQIDNFDEVKNLFKHVKIRGDIFDKLSYFTKYKIKGSETPDQIALKFYGNQELDWVVLLSNNIQNIQSEWSLSSEVFEKYLLEKYGSYDKLNEIRYYESVECKDSDGRIIFPSKIRIPQDYKFSYFDSTLQTEKTITNISRPITNFQYEILEEEKKRNIYILKPEYLSILFNDIKSLMQYKKGSTQYVSRTLKRADNIKLYPG